MNDKEEKQFCKFIECCIAEDYWCECEICGRKLQGFMKAEQLNKLNILHQEDEKKTDSII